MSEVLSTAWSIARSGWRANWNRGFRFSKLKASAIYVVLQGVFFLLVARRAPAMAAAGPGEGLAGLLALVAVQMGWFGIMFGFMRGQSQLYQGILVPLFQLTPARPLSFLIGRVIESVPSRAWSCLLWGWAYSAMVAGPARAGVALLLTVFGLAVGMVAHLSGLLLLSFWSRYSPKTMKNGTVLFGTVTLAMVTAAVIYLAQGGSITQLALLMRQYRLVAYGTVLAITGIPGLALLGAVAVRPAAVEDLYRRGVYQVIELNDSDVDRSIKSIWLPIPEQIFRAVLSREWLELARSKVARVQAMIWVAGTVGVYFAGRGLAGRPPERLIQFIGGLSLLTWFMAYGHWVVRVFEKERKTMLLYRLATVPAGRLLGAKFLSIFVPSALLVTLSVLIGTLAAGAPAGTLARVLAWALGALAAGTVGGFGAAAATSGEGEDQEMENAPRREGDTAQTTGNQAWWAIARTGALLLTAVLPLWIGAGLPGLPFHVAFAPLLTAAAALPALLLAGGYWLMERAWSV